MAGGGFQRALVIAFSLPSTALAWSPPSDHHGPVETQQVGSHPGWYPEVADGPCEGNARNVRMPDGKSFYVQALWSNSAGRCVFGT